MPINIKNEIINTSVRCSELLLAPKCDPKFTLENQRTQRELAMLWTIEKLAERCKVNANEILDEYILIAKEVYK